MLMQSQLDKYETGIKNWTEALNNFKGQKWPFQLSRKEAQGLIRIWRGYLIAAGRIKINRENDTTTE